MTSAPAIGRSLRRAEPKRFSAAWRQAPRFVRNAAISFPTFLIDLGLLSLLVRRAHVGYLVATVVSFLVANGLSYFLARRLVFGETRRGVGIGLLYFLAIATLSALALTPLMWLSVSVFRIDVILSRITVASIVGVGGYLLNLMVNFQVARPRSGPAHLSSVTPVATGLLILTATITEGEGRGRRKQIEAHRVRSVATDFSSR
jgi:putative flippase GtrA